MSRPTVNVSFTSSGQTSAVAQSYASLSGSTYGSAILSAPNESTAIGRALFPNIARGEPLDIVFVVDTTASMGWMMDAVKADLHAVVTTLAATNPDARYGLVAFRDRGDSFVTQTGFALDKDQSGVHRAIDWLNPNGGGDYPEHVYAGVMHGLQSAGTWRPHAKHHVVVIGDAPAQDYPGDAFNHRSVVVEAQRRQVRIHTVAIACAFVCKKELGLL